MKQNYSAYKAGDFEVWKLLFERQMSVLADAASSEYLRGIEKINFSKEKIPDFAGVNKLLSRQTGWGLEVVAGIIPENEFFPLLANKKFPATTWLRKKSQLDYLEEPDMFHDVFGHVPLLTNKNFCDFFEAIGKLGVKHIDNGKIVAMLGRIYWFTVEFGLIRENGKLKIYGAGILSSHGETKFSLSEVPAHFDFDAEVIMNTPFQNDRIQDKYFVIDSFRQLYDSVENIRKIIDKATSIA